MNDNFNTHPEIKSTTYSAQADATENDRAAEEAGAKTKPQRVLEFVESEGDGATYEEVADATHLPIQSVTPTLTELSKKGLVKASGRTRPTRTGSSATVWVAGGEKTTVKTFKITVPLEVWGMLETLSTYYNENKNYEDEPKTPQMVAGEFLLKGFYNK